MNDVAFPVTISLSSLRSAALTTGHAACEISLSASHAYQLFVRRADVYLLKLLSCANICG